MNIAMLIARFPPVVGGTEIQCDRLSRALASQRDHVVILTEKPNTLSTIPTDRPGIEIQRLATVGRPPWSSLIYCIRAFWRLMRQARFDILHAHMIAAPAVLAVIIGKARGIKTVVKVACSGPYGDLATSRQTLFGRWKLKWVLGHVDRLISLTHDIEQELLTAGVSPAKIVRIPNGIDTDQFRPSESAAEKRQTSRCPLRCFPARFRPTASGETGHIGRRASPLRFDGTRRHPPNAITGRDRGESSGERPLCPLLGPLCFTERGGGHVE